MLEAIDAHVIGFGGANLAGPNDAEEAFAQAPGAADFDGLPGSGEEAYAVKTSTILAEIDGIGGLGEGIAFGILAFNDDAERLGNARLFAILFPEIGNGLFEGQADPRFVIGVTVHIGDADFLFRATGFVDEKNRFAQFLLGFHDDERAAGVDGDGFGFFVEGAAFAGKTVDDYGCAHVHSNAGAGSFLGGAGRCARNGTANL